jgi:hypothetical protein
MMGLFSLQGGAIAGLGLASLYFLQEKLVVDAPILWTDGVSFADLVSRLLTELEC